MPVCTICQGDLLLKLDKVVQNEQVCNRDVMNRQDSPTVEDTAAKRPKNCPNKVRKYEATYVKYGFIALQKNGLDYRHVI